jgi:hypothetical protein
LSENTGKNKEISKLESSVYLNPFFPTDDNYLEIINNIQNSMPEITKATESFYKSASQFKNVVLDVTELTPINSIKHILAVIDQTKKALQDAYIKSRKNEIEQKKKKSELSLEIDPFAKELLEIEIVELEFEQNTIQNLSKGAFRKLSFFVTQYNALLTKIGKEHITEEEFEADEKKYHIMTAMKQALVSARPRGGIIDEGNQIYLFELGINGATAQKEIIDLLTFEQELIEKGIAPSHDLVIQWLEDFANKYIADATSFAEYRGFVVTDEKSLLKEVTNE